jgi:hypothetical protein
MHADKRRQREAIGLDQATRRLPWNASEGGHDFVDCAGHDHQKVRLQRFWMNRIT